MAAVISRAPQVNAAMASLSGTSRSQKWVMELKVGPAEHASLLNYIE